MIPPGYVLLSHAYARLVEVDSGAAFGRLKWHLTKSDLKASTFDEEQKNDISARHWQRYRDAELEKIFKTNELIGSPYLPEPEQDPLKVVVLSSQLDEIVDLHSKQKLASSDAKARSDARGRGTPPKYAGFVIKACMLLARSSVPFNSALELKKATLEALADNNDGEISEDLARTLSRQVFDRWKQDA